MDEYEDSDVGESSLDDLDSERQRAINWRYEQLLRSGQPAGLAAILADDLEVDLHRACDMTKQGVQPELVVAILA